MTLGALSLLLAMGLLAGMINAAVGSGSLLTLPVLLALGVPPGTAVRTNTIGMLFSTIGAVAGYRREIAAERRLRLGPLVATVLVCAGLGSVLLLVSPPGALAVVVPILIAVALALVLIGPRIGRALARRRATVDGSAAGGGAVDAAGREARTYRSPGLLAAMGAASLYGGYFTAAQGVLYLGILGAATGRPLRSVNAIKNLLALLVNLVAACVYLVAHVALGAGIMWEATAAIAVGSLLGAFGGSFVARRLPESVFRAVIVVVALVALASRLL
ncbi:sulfite exporter TauE/SafE family protein [Brachybacterium huguangmaarense]